MPPPTTALSSNWAALQKTLADSRPPKRKPAADPTGDSRKPDAQRKRPRNTSTPHPTKKKMTSATPAAPPPAISASVALWAEDNDIPAADLARAYGVPLNSTSLPATPATPAATTTSTLPAPDNAKTEVGKYVAMDCEMVGVGEDGSALARVSVVNFHGHCVLDTFVRPKEKVTDWRTWVSGVRPSDMEGAVTFEEAQRKVAELLDGRILVGHAIKHDLEVLLLGHSRRDIRDTSRFPEFRKLAGGKTPGLKKLARELLGIEIQGGQHSSIEDARACMLLYRKYKTEFEQWHEKMFPSHTKQKNRPKQRKKKK